MDRIQCYHGSHGTLFSWMCHDTSACSACEASSMVKKQVRGRRCGRPSCRLSHRSVILLWTMTTYYNISDFCSGYLSFTSHLWVNHQLIIDWLVAQSDSFQTIAVGCLEKCHLSRSFQNPNTTTSPHYWSPQEVPNHVLEREPSRRSWPIAKFWNPQRRHAECTTHEVLHP